MAITLIYQPDKGVSIDDTVLLWNTDRQQVRKLLNEKFEIADNVFDLSQYNNGDASKNIIQRRDIYENYKGQKSFFFLNFDDNDKLLEIELHYGFNISIKGVEIDFSMKVEKIAELLRDNLPNVKLVQVIHVIDDNSVKEAIEISNYIDAILLDSGNPKLSVKELGGTGRTHNWDLSKEIRKSISVPLFLAGGLNKDNVRQAIETVQPFGIDLCSSVRTQGKLDPQKLKDFFNAIGN